MKLLNVFKKFMKCFEINHEYYARCVSPEQPTCPPPGPPPPPPPGGEDVIKIEIYRG